MVKAHFSKRIGKFTGDRRVLVFLILASLLIAGRVWLAEHPEHDPWAPLDLRDPVGWATEAKLQSLREDVVFRYPHTEESNVARTFISLSRQRGRERICPII